MPPDNSLTNRPAHCERPTSSSFSSTTRARCAADSPRNSSPKPTLSRTVRHGKQSKLLEDHGDPFSPQAAQIGARAGGHIRLSLAVAQQHAPARDRIEAIRGAQQRGFPRARQAPSARRSVRCSTLRFASATPNTTPNCSAICARVAAGIERFERQLQRSPGLAALFAREQNIDVLEFQGAVASCAFLVAPGGSCDRE